MKKILLGIVVLLLITSVSYCQESKQPLQRFDKSGSMNSPSLEHIRPSSVFVLSQLDDEPSREDPRGSPLELTIKSDKEVYKAGEEIKIIVTLSNVGNEPQEVVVEGPMFYAPSYSLLVDGERPKLMRAPFVQSPDTQTDVLQPGQQCKVTLSCGSPESQLSGFGYIFSSLSSLGEHEILVKYLIKRGPPAAEYITSNTLTIEVVGEGKTKQKLTTQSKNLNEEVIESWERQKDFFVESNFEIIDWEDAKKVLLSRKVKGGKQYHTGWLTIYTLEGGKYLIKQPKIDALWQFMREHNLKIEGFGTE